MPWWGSTSASADDSAELLAAALARVVSLDAPGLARALAAGVDAASGSGRAPGGRRRGPDRRGAPRRRRRRRSGPRSAWYWIVHDDSAPQPDCLAALLRGADRNPAAAVLVPKTVAWSDPGRLVGVGNRWAPGTPVVDPLDPTERDQGQYDVDRAVYAGDSAGMLVRADLWHRLGGMDPNVGDWAAPADLCRRAWGAGAEVTFVPSAVLAHRQAGHRGVRAAAGRSADHHGHHRAHPRRSARAGQLTLELSQAPLPALPWRYLRAVLSSAMRVLAVLLTREPEEASAEVAGAWHVLGHPVRIRRARKSLRRPPVTDLRRPPDVRARRGAALSHALDGWAAGSRQPSVRRWWPPPARIWRPSAVAGALALAAFLREPGQLFGAGTLRGGGLLPAPGAVDLLTGYLEGWHPVRFGTPVPMPAHLPLLAAASLPTLGSVDIAASPGVRSGGAAGLPELLRQPGYRASWAATGSRWPSAGRCSRPAWRRWEAAGSRPWPCCCSAPRRPGWWSGRCGLPAPGPVASGPRSPRGPCSESSSPSPRRCTSQLCWAPCSGGSGSCRCPGPDPVSGACRDAGRWSSWGSPGCSSSCGCPGSGPRRGWCSASWGSTTRCWARPGRRCGGCRPAGRTPWPGRGSRCCSWRWPPWPWCGSRSDRWPCWPPRSVCWPRGAWLDPIARELWPDLGTGMLWPGVFLMLAAGLLALLVARITARPGLTGELVSVAWLLCIGVLLVGWWVAAPSSVGRHRHRHAARREPRRRHLRATTLAGAGTARGTSCATRSPAPRRCASGTPTRWRARSPIAGSATRWRVSCPARVVRSSRSSAAGRSASSSSTGRRRIRW